ncbi:MAG: transcriptional regulator NrdR [Patescibacteria group bacterium]
MKCPYCTHDSTEVVETRDSEDLSVTRRRRECTKCTKRFTTYERIETIPLTVIKKSGTRESFDREKLASGIRKAAEKTSVTHAHIEEILDEIERELRGGESIEIESKKIGLLVANKLKKKDKVAYIRFASVFRRFVDLEEFEKELHKLL